MNNNFNPFKNINSNPENQAGNFDVNNNYPNQAQNLNYHNPNMNQNNSTYYAQSTAAYQNELVSQKNKSNPTLITPRNKTFENSYYRQAQQVPQYEKNQTTGEIYQKGYLDPNKSIYQQQSSIYNNYQQPVNQNLNSNYQNVNPQIKQNNYNNVNQYQQEYIDFNKNQYIDYGNYRDEYAYNQRAMQQKQIYNQVPNQYQQYNQNYMQNNINPIYEQQVRQSNMNYGYNEFSNNNQFYNPNFNYNPAYNYNIPSSNHYDPYANMSYNQRMQQTSIIPKEIAKEIKSEKLRIALLFILGSIGILFTSLMLAIYYKTINPEVAQKYLGLTYNDVMYPFFSITFLIISIAFFGVSLTDYALLHSNVKKYERDLMIGNESVPYFITRNYKSLISRSVYITWICFSIYIVGAITLGIFYGLEAQYKIAVENKNTNIYFLWWKIGELKSFQSEITVNILVLFITLAIHVANIVSSRNRKNNIISYYGYEIIPQQEIKDIKKRANKICIIIMCITIAIILFAIVIPWLIIRKKRGQSLKPWGTTVQ